MGLGAGNGRGGARPGSGRKPKVANDNIIPLKKPERPRPMFSDESVMAIIDAIREQKLRSRNRPRTPDWNPYIIRPDLFGPVTAHVRKHNPRLAMDQNGALTDQNMFAVQSWMAGGMMGNDAAEGMLFLGYPFLSELAQRAEFRLFGEIMSEEMTRKFIDFRGTDDESIEDDDKEDVKDEEEDASAEAWDQALSELRPGDSDELEDDKPKPDPDKKPRTDGRNKEIERKIIELRHFAEDIKLRQVFKLVAQHDSQFGIGHLFLDLKGANVEDPRDPENRMSIGNGRDEQSKAKLGRNCLKGIRTIEPLWCYPTMYNAMNPLHHSWYDPEVWYVMGSEIHKTRLIPFVGRPVPDILKPAYAFGGLPMTQMAQPYVDLWLRTRESVAELIHAFSIMVLQTNMGTIVQPGGAAGGSGDVIARMMLMNAMRDNQGMMIIDKATEDFKNISAPLGTLDSLQAQAQEHMYSIARIPAVKWTGIQPQGLNATSEGEMRAFNDTVHGYQEQLFRVGLQTVVDIMMISLWGERDPDIVFDFEELHELTEKEQAEVAKIKAETDQIRTSDASGNLWPSGIYSAKLTDVGSGTQSCIWFVVRNDASQADIVFPAASAYEKDGSVTNTAGEIQLLRKAGEVMGTRSDFDLLRIMSHQLEKQGLGKALHFKNPAAVFEEICNAVPGYNVHFAGLLTGGAEPTKLQFPRNGHAPYDVPVQLIRSANDSLFTSGTLGRFCSMLQSLPEAHAKP